MPNPKLKVFGLQFELILHSSCCFLMCWHKSPKKGEIEREMCPWAICIIVLVIRCPTKMF
jgi:hypothetical protein